MFKYLYIITKFSHMTSDIYLKISGSKSVVLVILVIRDIFLQITRFNLIRW